jgi:hypothetical protein
METHKEDEIVDTNRTILEEIKKLQIQISNLEKRVNNTNGVLINHIGFINNVFDTIKRPLFFIMNKINGLLQLEEQAQLQIKNNSNHTEILT